MPFLISLSFHSCSNAFYFVTYENDPNLNTRVPLGPFNGGASTAQKQARPQGEQLSSRLP